MSELEQTGTQVMADVLQSELSQLSEMHNTFIRNVSHELRTPLAVLMGYADLLNEGELGPLLPEQQEAMLIIVNRAHEMKDMIARIGTLLAVQAQQYVKQPVMLSTLVAQMAATQRAKAEHAGINLEIDFPAGLPSVIGDSEQLQLAIECLVENGLKFTPYGGNVAVRLWSDPDWVNLAVSDTGIGIAEEDVARLFQPFQQLDDSNARLYGGLGLGLTLVRNIVDAHGGQIEAQSQPGQGSCFTIKLPIVASIEDVFRSGPDETAKRRILIVDDEEFVALTLREGLEKLPNCEVMISVSGKEALQLFEQQSFDLLITDYKIPDLNGVALAGYVRQRYPTTAIIMITAYSHDLIREPQATVSIQRVLNKPVRLAEIRDVALETLSLNKESQSGNGGAEHLKQVREE